MGRVVNVFLGPGLLLLAAGAAIAAQWQRVDETGRATMCLDVSSVGPGPSNYTQYKEILCELIGKSNFTGAAFAVECAAVRRGDDKILTLSYNSGAWEKSAFPTQLASPSGKLLQAVCNAAATDSAAGARDSVNDWKRCGSNEDANWDVHIGACTRIINSGKEHGANLANAYHNRGVNYYRQDDYDHAIADFDQALRINPKLSLSYWYRGSSYFAKHDYNRAMADVDAVSRLEPPNNKLMSNIIAFRGSIWLSLGNYDRAIADLDRAIQLDVLSNSDAKRTSGHYSNRGLVFIGKRDYDRAIADFENAIRLNPKNDAFFNNRGTAWREKGDFERAIADFDHAIQLDQKSPNPYSNRGLVRRATGDLDRAITDFDQALRLDPDYADAYTNRGLIYEAKGDFARAEKDYRSAIAAPAKHAFSARYQETAKVRIALLTDQSAKQAPLPPPTPTGTLGRRSALVIGNGAYANATALPNPPNDARAVAKDLREMGFEVSEGIDLDREAMKQTVNDFLRNAATAKIALIFYAGHGMQIDGRNYLVPIDANLADAKELAAEMTDVDTILVGLDDQIRTNIIILDACRDNPIAQKAAQVAASRSVVIRSGLAAPSGLGSGATAGAGTLIAFATAPGQVTLDGETANSPFTTALVRHLPTQGLEVQQMLTRVRSEVVAATKSKQVPWSNSSLLGEVFLMR